MDIDIKEYIKPLLKWWWLIVLTTLVAAVSSFLATRQQTPVYRSTTKLMIGSIIEEANPSNTDFSIARQLATTYVDIANGQSVRAAAMDVLGLAALPAITVRQLNDTNIIEITVTANNPEVAQAVAAELANQVIKQTPAGQNDEDEFLEESLAYYQAAITELREEIALKEAQLGSLKSAREIAEVQTEIQTAKSNLQELTTSYSSLLTSSSQGATNTITIVEPALPGTQVAADNIITIITAAGIGLVLSASAAYVLEYLDDTVKTEEQIQKLTKLPTLAGIAEIRGEGGNLITVTKPRSPTAEAFRVLRTAIQYTAVDKPNRILLVTSAVPQEGKSTTSSNLAVIMAQAGHSVLLIDADLRRPSQHHIFGLSNKRGLTNFLLEFNPNATAEDMRHLVEDTAQTTRVEGLQVLACGPIPPNPSELLGSVKMKKLLAKLAEQFDFVILDSPPVLSVTDAAVLSTLVDGTLFVVKANKSRRAPSKQAVERLREVNARLVGAVLNALSPRTEGYSFYYYYRDPYYTSDEEGGGTKEEKPAGKLRKRFLRGQPSA